MDVAVPGARLDFVLSDGLVLLYANDSRKCAQGKDFAETRTSNVTILQVNGSKIKGWWLSHHYLSCAVPGIVLTWKEGVCYQEFRPAFLLFVVYISLVQLAQNQYQSGCLRRLHALGQGHQMDITVEGFTSWQFKGLTFLLPFLTVGYVSY